jgi:type IV secretion system protein VirD4
MVKVYDPDKKLRQVQNFGILFSLYGSIVLATTYISCILCIFLVEGAKSIKILFQIATVDPLRHLTLLVGTTLYYWEAFYLNFQKISFLSYNFLLLKILLSALIPFGILSYIAYLKKDFIMYYEPIKKEASIHGDAHWASERELIKAGLRAKKGMLMGQDKKGYLIAGDYQHTLLFAPTGSGKGVGFVIPNGVFWEDSYIVHDIKLENFQKGSGYRANVLNQKVFCWVPADPDGVSHCYNPMDWISKKMGNMVDDVQKLANILLPKQEFWTNEARTLLVGIILWLIADPAKPKTFGEVVRTIRSDDFAYAAAVAMDTLGDIMHPIGYMNLASALQKADKERSGVISTLNSGLELWGNPIIDATTARSDFNFMTFKIEPTTVFVGLTPDNIQRLKPLMTMFYQQATAFMSQHMPTKEEKYGVLFLMDEFPTVGKLEQFLAGIAYFRGYRVRLFLVVQDTQQLKGTYEDTGMNSFLSNSTYRITFAANNYETAKLISDLIGNQTVEQTSGSKSKFLDINPGGGSISISQSSRALLLPQEVINMPKDDQIILIEASAPVRTKKIKYFLDKKINSRTQMKWIDLPTQQPVLVKRPPKNAEGGVAADPNQKRLSDD